MTYLLTNWKTSLGGLLTLGMAALTTFVGVKIPGFNLDFGAALPIALSMFYAKDANVTGGDVKQP